MYKPFIKLFLLFSLITSSNVFSNENINMKDEKIKALIGFLEDSIYSNNDNIKLQSYLSDNYFKTKPAKKELYQVNNYRFLEYEIIKINNDLIDVRIMHHGPYWERILQFKVINENGKYVLYPSNSSYVKQEDSCVQEPGYYSVDPWWKEIKKNMENDRPAIVLKQFLDKAKIDSTDMDLLDYVQIPSDFFKDENTIIKIDAFDSYKINSIDHYSVTLYTKNKSKKVFFNFIKQGDKILIKPIKQEILGTQPRKIILYLYK